MALSHIANIQIFLLLYYASHIMSSKMNVRMTAKKVHLLKTIPQTQTQTIPLTQGTKL